MNEFSNQAITRPNGEATNSGSSAGASTSNARIDSAALAAHETVDKVADRATVHVDRISGTAHRAVNSTADAAASAAEWASSIPDQAKNLQATASDAVCNSIRSRPLSSVVGAVAVGYLLGRLARI
jgi:hypothetical protein